MGSGVPGISSSGLSQATIQAVNCRHIPTQFGQGQIEGSRNISGHHLENCKDWESFTVGNTSQAIRFWEEETLANQM